MRYYDTIRRILKIFFYLIVFSALFLSLSVALFTFSDAGTQARILRWGLQQATGGEVTLKAVSRFRLVPEFHLELEGVGIGKARRGPVSNLEAEVLALAFPWRPLLSRGRLELRWRQEDGVLALKSSPGGPGGRVAFRALDLSGVALTLQRGRLVEIDRLQFEPAPQGMRVVLEARAAGGTIRLEGRSQGAEVEGRRPWRLEGRLGSIALQGDGWVAAGAGQPDYRLKLEMAGPASALAHFFDRPVLAQLGRVQAHLELVGGITPKLEMVRVESSGGPVKLEVRGTAEAPWHEGGLDLHWRLKRTAAAGPEGWPAWAADVEGEVSGRLEGRWGAPMLNGIEGTLSWPGGALTLEGSARWEGRRAVVRLEGEGRVREGRFGWVFAAGGEDETSNLRLSGTGWRIFAEERPRSKENGDLGRFRITAEADRLERLQPFTALSLQAEPSARFDADLHLLSDKAVLDSLRLQVGRSRLEGALAVTWTEGRRSRLEGRLHAPFWDWNELLRHRSGWRPALVEGGGEALDMAQGERRERLFSEAPLRLVRLGGVEGVVDLSADEMRGRRVAVEALRARLSVERGTVDLKLESGRLGGRPLRGRFRLDGAEKPPRLILSLAVEGADLAKGFPGLDLPPRSGRVSLALDLEGWGESLAAIAATLDGKVRLLLEDSPFGLGLPEGADRSLVERLNPLARDRARERRVECAALYIEVRDGQVHTPRGLVVRFPSVLWVGGGVMDLKRETLFLQLKPRPRRGLGLSLKGLADLVAVGGPLTRPVVVINPEGALLTSLSYAAAVYTGGVSLVLERVWERVRLQDDACRRVFEDVDAEGGTTTSGPEAEETSPGGVDVLDTQ